MPNGAVIDICTCGIDDGGEFRVPPDQIGFTPNMFRSEIGLRPSAGGSFPHRLAGNIWEGGGRAQRPRERLGSDITRW